MSGFVEKDSVPIGVLLDLTDERRAAKTGLPQSDKDVTEGRVVLKVFAYRPTIRMRDGEPWHQRYPSCVLHGAMNAVSNDAHIWRCSECGVGCLYRCLGE